MTYVTVNTSVEVEVNLDEFDDDDLIDELETRGYTVSNQVDSIPAFYNSFGEPIGNLIEELYGAYTTKKTDKVNSLLVELFDKGIGRIA